MSFQTKIEFIFELIDKVSPEINKMRATIDKFINQLTNFSSKIKQFFKEIPIWAELYLEQASKSLKNFGNRMQKFGDKMRNMGGKMSLMSLPMDLFAKSAYNEFAEFEQLQTRMAVAFQENSDRMIKSGQEFAMKTALSTEQVFGLMASLKQSIGMGTEEIMPFIEDYTTALYGLGAGKNFDAITEQIKQGLGKGKLELMDIKIIESWGLPIKKMIAETLGVTTADVMDMISEKGGKGITPRMLQDTLRKFALDPRFADSITKYAQSSSGAMDRLGETYTQFKISFGKMLNEGGMNKMINKLATFFEKLANTIDKLSPQAKKFWTYFTLIAIVLPVIILSLGIVTSMISSMVTIFRVLLSPSVLINAAIVGIIASIIIFRKEIWNAIKAMGEFLYKWTGIKFIVESIQGIFQWIGDKIQWLSNLLTSFILKFKGLTNIANKIGDFFTGETRELRQSRPITELPTSNPVQQLLQTRSSNTTNSNLAIDLNINGVPKGSSVKTNASNIMGGMSTAVNYSLAGI